MRPLDPQLTRRWASDAHAAGMFVVSDEIQVGLRRCGPFSLAVANGLEPDAVLFGKALGGGVMPLAALVATEAFAAPLTADPTWHSATFGGHPLSCAAGRAALDALDALAERGARVGERVGAGLRTLAAGHPDLVSEVRGMGLIWGVEFTTPAAAGAALVELGQHGLLVSPCLSAIDTIRLLPPMVATDAEIERALEVVAEVLPLTAQFGREAGAR